MEMRTFIFSILLLLCCAARCHAGEVRGTEGGGLESTIKPAVRSVWTLRLFELVSSVSTTLLQDNAEPCTLSDVHNASMVGPIKVDTNVFSLRMGLNATSMEANILPTEDGTLAMTIDSQFTIEGAFNFTAKLVPYFSCYAEGLVAVNSKGFRFTQHFDITNDGTGYPQLSLVKTPELVFDGFEIDVDVHMSNCSKNFKMETRVKDTYVVIQKAALAEIAKFVSSLFPEALNKFLDELPLSMTVVGLPLNVSLVGNPEVTNSSLIFTDLGQFQLPAPADSDMSPNDQQVNTLPELMATCPFAVLEFATVSDLVTMFSTPSHNAQQQNMMRQLRSAPDVLLHSAEALFGPSIPMLFSYFGEEVATCFGWALHSQGVMKTTLDPEELPSGALSTDSWDAVFPGLATTYPDQDMTVVASAIESPSVSISPSGFVGDISVALSFHLSCNKTDCPMLFSMNATAILIDGATEFHPLAMGVQSGALVDENGNAKKGAYVLRISVTLVPLSVHIASSNVGAGDDISLKPLLRDVFVALEHQLNEGLKQGVLIPSMTNFELVDLKLEYTEGAFVLASDVKYSPAP